MKTRVRSGRGALVRVLAACFVLCAILGQGSPRAAGAAQVAADAEVPDLPAMTLTPEDLDDEGLEGYGLGYGLMAFADRMVSATAESRGLDEDEVAEILVEDAGFVRRYDSYLSLPDELALLGDAGFPRPDCFWRDGGLAVYGGFKDAVTGAAA